MLTAARDRLARTLRGDAQTAFSVELTARTDDLSLEVEGFGPVKFPVTPAKARKLAGLGQPARFGRGEETLTDPDVRDTWEIPKYLVRADGGAQRGAEGLPWVECGPVTGRLLRGLPARGSPGEVGLPDYSHVQLAAGGNTRRPDGDDGTVAELTDLLREHFSTPVPRYFGGPAADPPRRLVSTSSSTSTRPGG
jgi:hypothetical protein